VTRALVIGYGSIGKRHARLLTELCDEVAVVSRRAIDFSTRYDTIDQALNEFRPETVVIASRTNEHYSDFEKLANNGYTGTVLVEKPLFDRPAALPQNQFGCVNVAFNLRFHPVIQAFREALRGRRIFALHASVGQYLPDWRADTDYRESYSAHKALGGGVLRDLCHEIDLVQWLAGPYQTMTALGGKVGNLEIDSDDAFTLLLELQNCPLATVSLNYFDTVLHRELIAHTNKGTLRANLANKTFTDGTVETSFSIQPDDTYKAQLTAFLKDEQNTLCSLSEGLSVTDVIAGAQTASSEKRWIQA